MNGNASRERAWMCLGCGYVMDAASSFTGEFRVPREDDVSLCMNCGEYYVRHADRWMPMTEAERTALEPEYRALLDHASRVRAAAVRTDLARGRGGRA